MKRSFSPVPQLPHVKSRMSESAFKAKLVEEGRIKMEYLPENMIHLGDNLFIVVRRFQGQTRVHVRKFITDEKDELQPTTEGVSIPPKVWSAFSEKLPGFCRPRRNTDIIEIVQRDLCLSNVKNEKRIHLCLQRLYQRKDFTFQFASEKVVLNMEQVRVLRCSLEQVKFMMDAYLVNYSLRYHVEKELRVQSTDQLVVDDGNMDCPIGFHTTKDSLSKCLKLFLTVKIHELIGCMGCLHNSLNQSDHDCIGSLESRCEQYFDLALYSLNFADVAEKFITENVQYSYFRGLILSHDFFLMLNVQELLQSVKNLYVNDIELDALFPSLLM